MKLRIALTCALAALPWLGCKAEAPNALPAPVGSGVEPPAIPKVADLMASTGGGANRGVSGLTATGTLFPDAQAELGPKSSGVLSAVLVDEGQTVKKGQVLFRLESDHAGLGVEQARAVLQSAEVALRAAELDHTRTKELHSRGSVPQATYDQVLARYDSAKSAVAQARVALSMAQRASADTVVRSPIDGVITAKLKNVGETVTMMPPTIVLIVQDLRMLELRARIPERSLATLATGSSLRVGFPALGIERSVAVERINPGVDPLTRTVEVIAKLDNSDGRLRPGMLAEVALIEHGSAAADATGGTSGGAGSSAPPSRRAAAARKAP